MGHLWDPQFDAFLREKSDRYAALAFSVLDYKVEPTLEHSGALLPASWK